MKRENPTWICSGCEAEAHGGPMLESGWARPPKGWLIGADEFAGYGVCSAACAMRTERRAARKQRKAARR